jgi:hypothetical protein
MVGKKWKPDYLGGPSKTEKPAPKVNIQEAHTADQPSKKPKQQGLSTKGKFHP